MGYRKGLASLVAILLLIFLLSEASSVPDRPARDRSFTTGPSTDLKSGSGEISHGHGGHGGAANGDGEAILGGEKRRVYTGPNPLHNR